MNSSSTLVIVPTYNERENIHTLLLDLTRNVPDASILVVDDGSPDGTQDVVARFQKHSPQVHILKRTSKTGLASAYLAGFSWGLQSPFQKFIMMDADLSHSPSDVPRLIESLSNCDGVIGSRYIKGGDVKGWSMTRHLVSRAGNKYAETILKLPFKDLTAGFNGWQRKVIEKFHIGPVRSQGYAFQIELKTIAFHEGFKIVEIPICFEDRRFGQSKMTKNIISEAAIRVLEMRRILNG